MPILFFVVIFGLMYLVLLRPQQQRVRRQRELLTAIGVGDRVVTAGGLIGRVVDESDDRLLVEISDGVVVEILRLAISRRLDESESAFVSVADEAELEGGYEESDPSDELASTEEPSEEAGHAAESELAIEAPAQAAAPAEGAEPAPEPTVGAGNPDGSTPGAAAPAPGQDPH